MNSISPARERAHRADLQFNEISRELQQAALVPNGWRDRPDIAPLLERLRQFSQVDPQRASHLWDRLVPGDHDKPAFLDSRDGGRRPPQAASREGSLASPLRGDPATRLDPIEQLLRKRYLFDAGKYHYREGNRGLAFEDRGNALSSPVTDQAVIKSMLDLAEHRGWQSLQVSGTPEFRRAVWLAASERGLQPRGFQPTRIDRAELNERLAEQTRHPAAARAPSDRLGAAAGNPDPEMKLTARQTQYLDALRAELREQGASDRAITKVVGASRELLTKDRTYAGRVIDHGPAHFEHDPKASLSYFIRLETDRGERVIWGKDLGRALQEGDARSGDAIALRYLGAKAVVVDEHVRDVDGRITETNKKETRRNAWEVTRLERMTEQQRQTVVEQARATQREPQVRVWDRQAPSDAGRARQVWQQPSRQPERTRG